MELKSKSMAELTTTDDQNMIKTIYKYNLINSDGRVKISISSEEELDWLLPKSSVELKAVETQTSLKTPLKED